MINIVCNLSNNFLNKIVSYNNIFPYSPLDIKLIQKAISYVKQIHMNQFRISGEPHYVYLIEVANMFIDYAILDKKYYRTDLVVAAILRDLVEDDKTDIFTIESLFNKQISCNVKDLNKIRNGKKISSSDIILESYKQKKYGILLIKFFDRLYDLQTINSFPQEKIKETVEETLIKYLPLCEASEFPFLSDMLYRACENAIQ
jgi:(p)ppGpp synthase/HD superfamily hydrolase